MAHLLGAESLHLEYPTRVVFDSVTIGLDEGQRIGVVGRNGDGKSSLLRLLVRQARTRRRPGHEAQGHHPRHAGPGRRTPRRPRRFPSHRRRPRRARVGRGRAGSRRHRGPRRRHPVERDGRRAEWWPASPGRARGTPGGRLGHPVSRRTDQPSRRRGHRLAGRASEAPVVGECRRAHRRDPRPVVPGRDLHRHVGGARPHHRAVRGRIRRLHPAAGRARSHGRSVRVEAPEPDAQGAGVVAPRRSRALDQAQVQDGCGLRAHRKRAASARHGFARRDGDAAPRQGCRGHHRRERFRTTTPRPAARARCSKTSPGSSRRGSAPASSASTARARARCSAWCPARCIRQRARSSAARPSRLRSSPSNLPSSKTSGKTASATCSSDRRAPTFPAARR